MSKKVSVTINLEFQDETMVEDFIEAFVVIPVKREATNKGVSFDFTTKEIKGKSKKEVSTETSEEQIPTQKESESTTSD